MGESLKLWQEDFTVCENLWLGHHYLKEDLLKIRIHSFPADMGRKKTSKETLKKWFLKRGELRLDLVIGFERVFGISVVSQAVPRTSSEAEYKQAGGTLITILIGYKQRQAHEARRAEKNVLGEKIIILLWND